MGKVIGESSFFSQLTAFTHPKLQRLTCGVASLAMVSSQLGIMRDFTGYNEQSSLDWFLRMYAGEFENTKPLLIRPFGDIHIVVDPSGNTSDRVDGDYVKPAGSIYRPTYSLKNGFDHRGAAWLLQNHGVNASVQERISVQDLQNIMGRGVSYFLASMHYVNPVSGGISSHIVVVCIATREKILYVDPLPVSYQEAVKTVPLEEFAQGFRKYGTAIST